MRINPTTLGTADAEAGRPLAGYTDWLINTGARDGFRAARGYSQYQAAWLETDEARHATAARLGAIVSVAYTGLVLAGAIASSGAPTAIAAAFSEHRANAGARRAERRADRAEARARRAAAKAHKWAERAETLADEAEVAASEAPVIPGQVA